MKKKFFFREDLISRIGYRCIFLQGFNSANLAKIRENRENLSRKQFLSLSYSPDKLMYYDTNHLCL